MRAAQTWQDYELIDATEKNRLERWGQTILIRPDPQVVWKNAPASPLWDKADAVYHRSSKGGGSWETRRSLPQKWRIGWQDLTLIVSPTGFKHTGVFPEQAVNWEWYRKIITAAGRPIRVLNLFGYTGGATLACMAAGAHVTHVDAAKGMIQWGKENRELSKLPEERSRWIVEDALRFVQREIRRGNTYDGILMDPPSYGRGPSGEVWKLENELFGLVDTSAKVLSDKPLFFLINSYTTGFQASVLSNMLMKCVSSRHGGIIDAQELCLPVTTGGVLPCGASGRWSAK